MEKIAIPLRRYLQTSWKVSWVLILVFLPFTSFPLISKFTGGTLVAPLSILPLLWLVITWLPYYFIKVKTLPGELNSLIIFVLVALFSSGFAFFILMPYFKGHNIHREELEAIGTLGIGIAFLLTAVTRVQSRKQIFNSLVWINIGGIIFLLWSLVQTIMIVFNNGSLPPIIDSIQKAVSVANLRGSIRTLRIYGLTLEPSWLAHSLNMLYLPIWLAASRFKVSAFRFRLGKLSVENFLLIFGIITMFLTYSRIGLISFLFILAWFIVEISSSISKRISAKRKRNNSNTVVTNKYLVTGVMIFVLISSFLILFYTLSLKDNRFRKLLDIDTYTSQSFSFMTIARKAAFAERVAFWDFGWKVFNEYPILGVGLGNVGQFSGKFLSAQAWTMDEVRNLLFYATIIPNTKSLWVRLLSETGLVGFSCFLTWLIVMWFTGRKLYKQKEPIFKMVGFAGQLVLLAYIVEGFSMDTFALPYVWISMGIMIAASSLHRKQLAAEEI